MGLRHALSFYFLSLKTFLIIAWVGGMYIFTNFSLSHTHRPVVRDGTARVRACVRVGLLEKGGGSCCGLILRRAA